MIIVYMADIDDKCGEECKRDDEFFLFQIEFFLNSLILLNFFLFFVFFGFLVVIIPELTLMTFRFFFIHFLLSYYSETVFFFFLKSSCLMVCLFFLYICCRCGDLFTRIPCRERCKALHCPGGWKCAKTGNSTVWLRSLRRGRRR